MLLRFIMVCESLKIKHIPIQLTFCVLPFFLLFHKLIIFLKFFFIFVTFVITSCCISMLTPITQTYPAKLMEAILLSARHVVTPLIFFYRTLTFRTCLSVSNNPSYIFWFSIRFFIPKLNYVAITGWMLFKTTRQTSLKTTFALNCRLNRELHSLKAVFTSFLTAPTEKSILISKGFT